MYLDYRATTKETMFHIIWISKSLGIKAGEKVILRYIEFCMSNLATNTIK